jgi:hypothetical protein
LPALRVWRTAAGPPQDQPSRRFVASLPLVRDRSRGPGNALVGGRNRAAPPRSQATHNSGWLTEAYRLHRGNDKWRVDRSATVASRR